MHRVWADCAFWFVWAGLLLIGSDREVSVDRFGINSPAESRGVSTTVECLRCGDARRSSARALDDSDETERTSGTLDPASQHQPGRAGPSLCLTLTGAAPSGNARKLRTLFFSLLYEYIVV